MSTIDYKDKLLQFPQFDDVDCDGQESGARNPNVIKRGMLPLASRKAEYEAGNR